MWLLEAAVGGPVSSQGPLAALANKVKGAEVRNRVRRAVGMRENSLGNGGGGSLWVAKLLEKAARPQ